MSSVKAALTVTLKADEVVVAEIEDAALWQQVLTAINTGSANLHNQAPTPMAAGARATDSTQPPVSTENNALGQLASQLGIDVAQVQGACSPSVDDTFMRLDLHCWEEMKKQIPNRGPLSVAPIAVPATLLALWFSKAGLGSPTQAQAQTVLGTISLRDPNASRSIQNTVWLQSRPRRSGCTESSRVLEGD